MLITSETPRNLIGTDNVKECVINFFTDFKKIGIRKFNRYATKEQ